MKFSRVKQFLKSKKVIRTGACVLATVIVTGGVGAYHVYGQKQIMTRQQKRKKPFMWWLIRTEHPMRLL